MTEMRIIISVVALACVVVKPVFAMETFDFSLFQHSAYLSDDVTHAGQVVQSTPQCGVICAHQTMCELFSTCREELPGEPHVLTYTLWHLRSPC